MSQVRLCDGVSWEVVNHDPVVSSFSESGLELLSTTGAEQAVKTGDIQSLERELDEDVAFEGAANFYVRSFRSNPNVVVKHTVNSFAQTAVNVALGAGFAGSDLNKAHTYLGHIQVADRFGGSSFVIMSRVLGTQLSEIRSNLKNYERADILDQIRQRITYAGNVGLKNMGIDHGLIYWDLTSSNLFCQRPLLGFARLLYEPLTIIDQNCAIASDIEGWPAASRQVYANPAADRSADEASDKAWREPMSMTPV